MTKYILNKVAGFLYHLRGLIFHDRVLWLCANWPWCFNRRSVYGLICEACWEKLIVSCSVTMEQQEAEYTASKLKLIAKYGSLENAIACMRRQKLA